MNPLISPFERTPYHAKRLKFLPDHSLLQLRSLNHYSRILLSIRPQTAVTAPDQGLEESLLLIGFFTYST